MKADDQVMTTNTDPSRWVSMVKIKVKTQLGKLFQLYNCALFSNTMYMK